MRPRLPEVDFINPWLLGEKCKPIIVRNADKALHFVFHETLTGLTRAKRRRYQFPILIYLCLTPFMKGMVAGLSAQTRSVGSGLPGKIHNCGV